MLISADRRVFVGRRRGTDAGWQMPQGGVDKGEAPVEAACRELLEEIGTTRALLLRESRGWITYDVPAKLQPPHWKGRWRGQAQKWFALAFIGSDDDIRLDGPEPEFDAWQWVRASEVAGLIVPFKRAAYDAALREFADLVA